MRSDPQRNGAGNKKSKYAWGIAFLMGVALSFARVGAREMRTVAITGGTVITMAGPVLKGGVVLIKDGKIAAVGTDVIIPAHAEIIDAKGKFVMPGIIDAMTTYGIRPQALNDRDNPLTPENRIIQAYYPFGEFMQGRGGIEKDREILSGGVTTVYIAPGDQQVIGGQGAVVKTWGETIDRMTLREPAAIDMAIGDPPLYDRKAGSAKSPVNRMGLATLIRKALLNTQAFIKKQKDYENQSADEKAKTRPPARDLSLEALSLLLKRQIPARVEADLIDDLRTACRLSEEWGFDLVIDSGLGAYKMKDILAKKKIPVVLGSPSNPFIQGGEVAMTAELYKEMNEYNAKELIEAGVKTAIGSFGFSFAIFGYATQSRWLLLEAAYLTGSGVSDEDALKMVTINAAEILGVDGRIGSLVPGKDADVIILNGYPLNIKTWVDQVFIDGQCVYVRQGGR